LAIARNSTVFCNRQPLDWVRRLQHDIAEDRRVGDGDAMDAKTLPQVKMPNRDNFIMPYPDRL
jgi:hypothetical protein